ncbi:hypothetical protein HDV05_000672, partial [Chytridiales sp. JEL 0842]
MYQYHLRFDIVVVSSSSLPSASASDTLNLKGGTNSPQQRPSTTTEDSSLVYPNDLFGELKDSYRVGPYPKFLRKRKQTKKEGKSKAKGLSSENYFAKDYRLGALKIEWFDSESSSDPTEDLPVNESSGGEAMDISASNARNCASVDQQVPSLSIEPH